MSSRALYGVLCTYRRPHAVSASLRAIGRQRLRPDLVVVVDNDNDPVVRELVEEQTDGPAAYVAMATNGGPAGAFNAGLDALPDAEPGDLVVLFDDDDPPVDDASLQRLVSRFDAFTEDAGPVAGVGLRGGLLDIRRGRVRQPTSTTGMVPVDHLHGYALPVYSRAALTAVGGFDTRLFWGFEELDVGRRLSGAGHRLVVDMDHWNDVSDRYPKAADRDGPRMGVSAPTAGRYYGLRNLLRVLARQRAWRGIAEVVVVRAVGKPLASVFFRPRNAVRNLAVNGLAVMDASRGRLGRRDRFPGPCGLGSEATIPGRAA